MPPVLSSDEAFARYEAVRHRFPPLPSFSQKEDTSPRRVDNLAALTDHYDIFVFDAFGVLNVGDSPIEGACERIADLKQAGKQVLVLTNAASYCFGQVVAKFDRLGFSFAPEELISSRAVCEAHIGILPSEMVWGVIAPSDFQAGELAVGCVSLADERAVYDQVDAFLFLSTECWQASRQRMLVDSLAKRVRPVIVANPDLVAPREVGLTVEPGFYAHDLMDRVPDLEISFHGKPFPSVYDAVEHLVAVAPQRVVMIGDSLHTDIWGANVRGWGSVLVTDHGFLKGQDTVAAIEKSTIRPDWIVPAI